MSALTTVRSTPVDATPLVAPGSRRARHLVSESALVTVLLLVWVFAYLLVLSGFEQGHQQARLYGELRTALALGEAPTGAPIATGTPVALLDAPRAGIDHLVVVEGTDPHALQHGPGHAAGSVLPGQAGTSVLLGRSLSFGAPFGRVPSLRVGDAVTVTTVQGRFTYRVSGVRRSGDPVPPAPTAGAGRLVLVTAAGPGRLTPSDTVYVDAALDGTAQPAGPTAAADPQGAPLASDHGLTTLALLALALQLLVAALAWSAWARVRWSAVAAWVTGVPVVVAALWVTSSVATRLLPNLV